MQYLKQIQPHLPDEMVSNLTYFAQKIPNTNFMDIIEMKKLPVYIDVIAFWKYENISFWWMKLTDEVFLKLILGSEVLERNENKYYSK